MKWYNDIYEDWARKKQQACGAWSNCDLVRWGTSYCKLFYHSEIKALVINTDFLLSGFEIDPGMHKKFTNLS
jgi:hypothetical protein